MKLHAASGVAITCYCWHEQHMCNLQAGRDPRSTLRGDMLSTNCSWRTLADGRRFKGGKSLTVHVVADVELTAHSVYFVLALRLLWDGNRRRASRFAQMITSPGIAIIYVSRRIFSA